MASDRCTVFMERDINHLLFEGYSPKEILATVLHSIAENYISKVAAEKHIGSVICFQGPPPRTRRWWRPSSSASASPSTFRASAT